VAWRWGVNIDAVAAAPCNTAQKSPDTFQYRGLYGVRKFP
jgi:hypothetical protein